MRIKGWNKINRYFLPGVIYIPFHVGPSPPSKGNCDAQIPPVTGPLPITGLAALLRKGARADVERDV